MDIATIIDCNIIAAGVLFGFAPFDRQRVRAGWAKLAFGLIAPIWIAVGAFRLASDMACFQLGDDAFNRLNSYVSSAGGLVIGVVLALVLSGQFRGTKRVAEPGSSGDTRSLMWISILVCIVTIATAVMVFHGCRRALAAGAVSFAGSGVALVPGADWERTDAPDGRQIVCPPILIGQGPFDGGMIKVYATSLGADAQSGIALFRSKAAAMPGVSPDSFQQEDFIADSGVRGIRFSYESSDTKNGVATRLRTHTYLFPNQQGHCVAILYITFADADSDAVHQMILKTLILE
ncbi:MAG TPA: hypothetical protein VK815_18175 [Candidatus Acidoferrales bacterium]|jgi:hypothetical protein|nr:hypothetical protein [Candidatus Acidoferrales bacterium]